MCLVLYATWDREYQAHSIQSTVANSNMMARIRHGMARHGKGPLQVLRLLG